MLKQYPAVLLRELFEDKQSRKQRLLQESLERQPTKVIVLISAMAIAHIAGLIALRVVIWMAVGAVVLFLLSSAHAAAVSLASGNHRSKNIGIVPIVVAELKLRDVQRQILGTDIMERADNATLEDAPEAFNCVRVYRANYILASVVIDNTVRIFLVQLFISAPSVRCDQTDLVRHDFADETLHCFDAKCFDDARNDVTFALYRADDE